MLGGKPLIHYAVRAARELKLVDRINPTTDSNEIAEVGRSLGVEVPFLRPAHLAQDDTPMFPVIDHAVHFVEEQGWQPDIILLLQPTAPLRQPEHIQAAVKLLTELKCDSVVSVVEVPQHYAPDFVLKLEEGNLKPFLEGGEKVTRRQDTRSAYSRDGTIYAFAMRSTNAASTAIIAAPLSFPQTCPATWTRWKIGEKVETKMKDQPLP